MYRKPVCRANQIKPLRNHDARALLFGHIRDCMAVYERLGREHIIRWARSVAGRAQIARLNAERNTLVAPATLYAWAATPPPRAPKRRGPKLVPTGR